MACEHDITEINERLLDYQIIGGLPLERFDQGYRGKALFCVTEARTRPEIDRFIEIVRAL